MKRCPATTMTSIRLPETSLRATTARDRRARLRPSYRSRRPLRAGGKARDDRKHGGACNAVRACKLRDLVRGRLRQLHGPRLADLISARSRGTRGHNRIRAAVRNEVSALPAVRAAVPRRVTGSVSAGANPGASGDGGDRTGLVLLPHERERRRSPCGLPNPRAAVSRCAHWIGCTPTGSRAHAIASYRFSPSRRRRPRDSDQLPESPARGARA